MRRHLEGGFELDDDPARVDLEEVHRFLASETYWAKGRSRETVERLVREASRVVGLYHGGRQVGFARTVSDGQAFAYLADVYVLPELRGRGLGLELLREAVDRGSFADRGWLLHTADAHGLYRKVGFGAPSERLLERLPGWERSRPAGEPARGRAQSEAHGTRRSATLLKVNVDHVATLREARKGKQPDPFLAARAAEDAGAAGITLHLRQDRRHVQESDLVALKAGARTPINLEMAAVPEMLEIASRYRPEQVTLVPERREEITTEGGLQVRRAALAPFIAALRDLGILVSLFIDPDEGEIEASAAAGADAVELHTGSYANAGPEGAAREVDRLAKSAVAAARRGLQVFAGHGLDYENVRAVARVPEVVELNIGHAIVSRAIAIGFERAVAEMLERMRPE